MGVSVQLLHDI